MFTFLRRDLQSLVKWPLYLQDVQVVSLARQTAKCLFEKVPPLFMQVLLLSIFRVGSLFTVKWLCGLCTDASLNLKLFLSIRWFEIPFSSVSATISASCGDRVLIKSFVGCRDFSCCLWRYPWSIPLLPRLCHIFWPFRLSLSKIVREILCPVVFNLIICDVRIWDLSSWRKRLLGIPKTL